MKVSVIIPMYNTAAYIEDALRSVMSQSLRDVQIIVVDDGSDDGSGDIVRRLIDEDSRIELYSQENAGQSVARNTALRHATGEYLYYMDSDDMLMPDALQTMVEYCDRQHCDFCFFDGEAFTDDASQSVWNGYRRTEKFVEGKLYQGKPLLRQMIDQWSHRAVVWLFLIRRSYQERIRLTFHPGIIHEDELFTPLLMVQSLRVACLKRSLVRHRVRSASTMTTSFSERNLNCYITVADELLAFARRSEDKELAPLFRHFLRYTLDKVFYTGHVIPFGAKLRLIRKMRRKRYGRYVSMKSKLVFLFKR